MDLTNMHSATVNTSAWTYWWSRLIPTVHLTPERITLGYLVFGLSALVLSDVLLVSYLSDPLLSQAQTVKGGVEVLLTAGLIFVLTSRREEQLTRSRRTLERKQDELQVLHRVLRHNLRNDVNVIQAYAQMVRDEVSPERLTEQCEKMLKVAARISQYTEQAKKIEQVTASNEQFVSYDATTLVSDVLEENESITENVDVSVDIQGSAQVRGGPALPEAIDELVSNAIEHNDSESPQIRVSLRSSDPPRTVELQIADNGPGMPENEIKALEGRGDDPMLHSSGLGLWIAKWTVINAGGELDISGNDLGGTTVTVRLQNDSLGGTDLLSKVSDAR